MESRKGQGEIDPAIQVLDISTAGTAYSSGQNTALAFVGSLGRPPACVKPSVKIVTHLDGPCRGGGLFPSRFHAPTGARPPLLFGTLPPIFHFVSNMRVTGAASPVSVAFAGFWVS